MSVLTLLADSLPTNKLAVSQSSCRLHNSQTGQFLDWTSQLAEMFEGTFVVNNHLEYDFEKFAVSELTSPQIVQSAS